MSDSTPAYTEDQIGISQVRFSSSGVFATHKDQMVDPYTATRVPKEAQVEGTQYTPQAKGLFPAIVLLHDRWGLTTHIQAIAKQIAMEGYIVLAPNLYGRQGGMITANNEVADALAERLNEQDALQDVNACCEYLNTNLTEDALLENTKRNAHGIVGLGLGGGIALQFATRRRRLRAAVSFHGSLPSAPEDLVQQLYCPCLYHAVNHDGGSSIDDAIQFQQAAKAHDKQVQLHSLPDAPAGFYNPANTDAYRADAAQQAWNITFDFLGGLLKPS